MSRISEENLWAYPTYVLVDKDAPYDAIEYEDGFDRVIEMGANRVLLRTSNTGREGEVYAEAFAELCQTNGYYAMVQPPQADPQE